MKRALLEMLTDPSSGEPLALQDGELVAPGGARYEIRDGIPRLADPAGSGQADTFDTFSWKWTHVSRQEIEQRVLAQYAWYDERYGLDGDKGLAALLAGSERILEAGTGLGGDAARFARLAPHAEVVAIDLSKAIDVAAERFGGPANLHYLQADIMHLPFPPGTFDFISAEQVIHHTPDAAWAFAELAARLAPGGLLAAYLYRVKAPLRELADDWIRERATVMEPEEAMELGRDLAELGRELQRAGGTVRLERGVPLLGIEPGEHSVQRLVYWTLLKCFWNDDFSPNLNALVNYDWYAPQHASRHTPHEVREWCAAAGLEIVRLDVSEAAISALARRPAA
ncbi:MAG TPA: methyltransferase domain-containing protein [Solirubrobacteraceae bacterium]|nr:methyltransferase domain-containing protein [Solirubrobacteraceae bacterium]